MRSIAVPSQRRTAPLADDSGSSLGRLSDIANAIARRAVVAGWTLIELMIVVTIGGLVLTASIPQYRDWIATSQLANEAQQLASSMNLARAEAIKRGHRVNLCRTADRKRCGDATGWENGWLVFVDTNRNGQIDDDELVLRVEAAAPLGIRVTANRPVEDYVSYTSLGNARLLNGGLQMGTFTLCRPGLRSLKVVLANSGRVRVETARDLCA